MKTKLTILIAGLLLLAACAGDENGPPVFNAIDPSLSCPAGQVGWDFTTGGNETDVVVQRTGSEIKIQQVKETCASADAGSAQIDLTSSFRASCDNASKCERAIRTTADAAAGTLACANRNLTVKYKCGNEATEYNLSRLFWASSAAKIVKTPTNTNDSDTVLFTCGEQITIKGSSYVSGAGGAFSPIANNKLLTCNGVRRCYSNDAISLGLASTTSPTFKTKYYYTCGTSTAIREASAELGKVVDFSCIDDLNQSGFERSAAIYFKEMTEIKRSTTSGQAPLMATINARLKAACNGKQSCEFPVTAADFGTSTNHYKIEYWCGSSQGLPEVKYYYRTDLLGGTGWSGTGKIQLRCGGRLKIVDSSQPWVKTACLDGVRVCSLPPDQSDTGINFFCEGTQGAMQNAKTLYKSESYSAQLRDRTLECPIETARIGIELVKRFNSGLEDSPTLNDMSACNGQNHCLVPGLNAWNYQFKCSGTDEVKNGTVTAINGQAMIYMDCQAKPKVTEISGCITGPSSALTCKSVASSGCTVPLSAGSISPAAVRACTTDINVKYVCGSDYRNVLTRAFKPGGFPATDSPDGGAFSADGGALFDVTVDCPYDPTPRATPSTKKCIPATCPNNTKRNASMDCELDSNIQVFSSFTQEAKLEAVTGTSSEIKEGITYWKWIEVSYSDGAKVAPKAQTGTIWAYDVFREKGTGPNRKTVNGFRCILANVGGGTQYGIKRVYGEDPFAPKTPRSIVPPICFRNGAYGDQSSTWYQAARRAGINEQAFRNTFEFLHTNVVAAFDSKGRAIVSTQNAPNPVGFFYTPSTGFVDQYEYLQQQSQTSAVNEYKFVPSTQIDVEATDVELDQSQLQLSAQSARLPPTLDLNFGWLLLGDSVLHPGSPSARVASESFPSLRDRHLRATIEIAKADQLSNRWVASNSSVVRSVPISDGNAQEKIERLTVPLSRDDVDRMMSVKGTGAGQRPDGWMSNSIEVNSVFLVRVCLDFDGLARAPGATDIDFKYVSAANRGTTYKLGFTARCSRERYFTVTRDLFPAVVLVVNGNETSTERASTTAQGGDHVSTSNDQASQSGCRKLCTASADCGSIACEKYPLPNGSTPAIGVCAETSQTVACTTAFRSGMTSGGGAGFGRSIASATSNGRTSANADGGTEAADTNIALMNFNILDVMDAQGMPSSPRETRISLGRIWASVAAVGGALSEFSKKANPEPVKPWFKPSLSRPFGGKDPQPGLAFGVSAETFIFAGPVTLQVEVSASVALGFDIVLKLISDTQTIANMNKPKYPCLGATKCFELNSTDSTFKDANEDCALKGGRLAEVRTAAILTAVNAAAASLDGGVPVDVWIGAQASHIFADPKCSDLSSVTLSTMASRMTACKAGSVSRYSWVNGSTAFADSNPSGVLFNMNLYTAKHGFGALTFIDNTDGSPLPSGLLLKTTGALEAHQSNNELSPGLFYATVPIKKKYVCEYDPAARYKYNEITLTPGVELSAGVGGSACWPSNVIGACLAAEFKFITAGIGVEMGSRTLKLYGTPTATAPMLTMGTRGVVAKWEVGFLTGQISAEIRFFIGSENFEIVKYDGVARYEGELYKDVDRFRR